MKKKIAGWKYLVGAVVLLFSIQPLNAQAKQVVLKPGAIVSPTTKEVLKVGAVGFQDESYCFDHYGDATCPGFGGGDHSTYQTSWAFSLKNLSPTRSATNVRTQITFLDKQGKTLYQEILTVAHELKPGKTTYAAANDNGSDSKFNGVASATVKIVSKGWVVPTKNVVQNPILLESSKNVNPNACLLKLVCLFGDSTEANRVQSLHLTGSFNWLGSTVTNGGSLLIYLDASGNVMGGQSRSSLSWYAGEHSVTRDPWLTPYEVANIVNYLYVPTT